MKYVVTIVILILVAATACDLSEAEMSLDGPNAITKDERAWYEIKTTNLPVLGVVEYHPYINLDDDESISEEELIGGTTRLVPVNHDGVAFMWFYLNPGEYFESRDLAVPDATTVNVFAQIYLSPNDIFPIDTVSKDLKIVIESKELTVTR